MKVSHCPTGVYLLNRSRPTGVYLDIWAIYRCILDGPRPEEPVALGDACVLFKIYLR